MVGLGIFKGKLEIFVLEFSLELIVVDVMFSLVGWAVVSLGETDGVDSNDDPDKEFLSSSFLDWPTTFCEMFIVLTLLSEVDNTPWGERSLTRSVRPTK